MASTTPFDILGDDDNDDPSLLIQKAVVSAAAAPKKGAAVTDVSPTKQAKLPTKPVPPTQAEYGNTEDGEKKPFERCEGYAGSRGSFERRGGYGGRIGGFSNVDGGNEDHPRRVFERLSGTGHGNESSAKGLVGAIGELLVMKLLGSVGFLQDLKVYNLHHLYLVSISRIFCTTAAIDQAANPKSVDESLWWDSFVNLIDELENTSDLSTNEIPSSLVKTNQKSKAALDCNQINVGSNKLIVRPELKDVAMQVSHCVGLDEV